jgi:pimeloyl-ACP methyl ester carboxylesterase
MVKPVLLVHGGGAGPWEWSDVLDGLEHRGVRAATVQLTTRHESGTLADDERVVREALLALGEPAVLVGHSYSGMVITGASAGNANVAHLVYTCAAMPNEGQSLLDLIAAGPAVEATQLIAPIDDEPETATQFRNTAANDATDDQWRSIRDKLGAFAQTAMTQTASGTGWREHPSTYIVCTRDQLFSPALQRRMAANATTVVEIESGHMPTITQPARLAEIIALVAG